VFFLDQNLPGTLNITTRLRESNKVLFKISELQFVEKLKILSPLRVLDLLNHLHVGIENGLLIVTVQ
jgi:hypothetical protein